MMFFSLTVSIKRNCAKYCTLSLAHSSSFRAFWAKKRVIHLHQARKTTSGISIRHRFTELVSHQPNGPLLLDIKKPLHLCYRYPNFVDCHMVDHPIPLHQRRPSPVKNRCYSYSCLESTHFIVEQVPLGKIPGFIISTLGTNKSIWPPLLCKVLCARFVIQGFLLKLYQTTFFLPLWHLATCPRMCLKLY